MKTNYKWNELPSVARIVIIVSTVITLGVVGLIVGLGMLDASVTVTQSEIKISGLYGTTLRRDEIASVTLVEGKINSVGSFTRTNGVGGMGQTLRGHFNQSGKGSARLFVKSETPFVVHIETVGREDVFVNFYDADKTKALYKEIISTFGSFSDNGGPAENAGQASADWEFFHGLVGEFFGALSKSDAEAAAAMFDATMTGLYGAGGLKADWDFIVAKAGPFESIREIENATAEGYYICETTLKHEVSGVKMRVVFSEDGLIAGLFVLDYPELDGGMKTSGTLRDGFYDIRVVIGEGTDFPLNGILSMPNETAGTDKIPAVVIVHGSGPGDMDGTVFANKPYREIAEHLAANGIAALRYDKRTNAHGTKWKREWTVYEETIEDAVLAAKLLSADPRVDENKIFVIGHSLGGMLAPRINSAGGGYAGLIIMAGSPRYLMEISRDQNMAAIDAMEDGEEKDAAYAAMTDWDKYFEGFLKMPEEEAKTTEVAGLGGASAYYLQDLFNNPAEKFLNETTVPVLILQGGADFQVSVERDFNLYKEILAGRAETQFKLYEGLNHLFMPAGSAGITNIQEAYGTPANVDERVLKDIVEWIINN